jgi:fructose-specific component phosphotransferase system IIB-like protein
MPPPVGFPTSVNVNIPYRVTIAVDGSVTIETVDAQEYTLAKKDAQFNGFLVDDILNAFKVKNDSGYPSSANVTVEMDESAGVKSAFATALAYQLKTAVLSDLSLLNVATDHASLDDYLMDWANTEIVKQLAENGIAAALEAEGLKGMSHTGFDNDLTDGANAMYEGLVTITPTVRAVIATQIPNTKWMSAFNDAGEVMDEKLPLYDGGDSMTFQFIITQNFVVSEENKNVGEPTGVLETGIPIPGSVKNGNASGVVTSNVLGQYAVEARTINLVLTRPSPANYPIVRDGVAPTEPSHDVAAAAADEATAALSGTDGYNEKAQAAKSAYSAWDAENKKKIESVRAAAAVVDAKKVYDEAIVVQTSALAAAGDLKEGPLHNAAQRAIAAAEKARLDWVERTNDAAIALAALAAAPNDLEYLYNESKLASKAQATAYNAWTLAQQAAAATEDAYQAAMDEYRHKVANNLALQNSANSAAAKALDQFVGLSSETVAASTALEAQRGVVDTKHGLWVTAGDNVTDAQTAYDANKTEANAQDLAAKQILETKAEEVKAEELAKFNVLRTKYNNIAKKRNVALNTYMTAKSMADDPTVLAYSSPSDLADETADSWTAPA